jgi:hypothetical protein
MVERFVQPGIGIDYSAHHVFLTSLEHPSYRAALYDATVRTAFRCPETPEHHGSGTHALAGLEAGALKERLPRRQRRDRHDGGLHMIESAAWGNGAAGATQYSACALSANQSLSPYTGARGPIGDAGTSGGNDPRELVPKDDGEGAILPVRVFQVGTHSSSVG